MEVNNQVELYYAIVAGILLFLMFAITLILFFVASRKRLSEQQLALEIKESNHRLALLKSIIETTEMERKRIAGDLHDEIGSQLSTLRMQLLRFKKNLGSQQEIEKLTDESKSLIDTTIQSVRSISHNLLPPGLEKFGLINTIEDSLNIIDKTKEIQTNVFAITNMPILSVEMELAFFRIYQELLANTLRHANARNISVQFSCIESQVKMHYTDDGSGIDSQIMNENKGLGLMNIESRVKALSGSLEIQTELNKGFQAIISFHI
jgi:signal transduction histidine kinase